MDIKSIIDSEDTPPTRKPSVSIPVKSDKRPSPAGFTTQAPAYDNRRDIRPPQPSPLQTPSRNDSHFAGAPTHDNLSSPYQRTSPFGLNNGQHPYAQASNQSPHYSQQGAYYPHHEVNTANGPSSGRSFGPSTPSQTPTVTTPGSTGVYSAFQRPTSSHSVPTPNSAQHSSNILRESPQPSNSDHRALPQAQGGQRYTSQPSTPLGPPSTYNRPSLNIQRESPRAYSHQRSLSGGAAGQHEIPELSAATRGSPSAYREPRSSVQGHSDSRSRKKSVSVSPKTRLPSLPRLNSMSAFENPRNPSVGWSGHDSPARRNPDSDASPFGAAREPNLKRTPSRSVGLSGLLNTEPTNDTAEETYRPSQTKSPSNNDQDSDIEILSHEIIRKAPQSDSFIAPHQSPLASYDRKVNHSSTPVQSSNSTTSNHIHTTSPSQPSTIPNSEQVGATSRPTLPSQIESTSSFRQAALKTSNGLINAPLPPVQKSSRAKKQPKRPIHEPSETEVSGNDDNLLSQPAKKKLRLGEPEPSVEKTPTQETPAKKKRLAPPRVSRYEDVPIFAQSVRGPYRTKDLFEINRSGVRTDPPTLSTVANAAASTERYHAQANGALAANSGNPPPHSNSISDGILGPWEYNIANIEPLDELIKGIANFMFESGVVSNKSVGVASAGGGRGLGAIFEVEAKIGRIIDNNTNDRIYLPVESECILKRTDPSIKTRFESSMTQVSLHPWILLTLSTNQLTIYSNNILNSTNSSIMPL